MGQAALAVAGAAAPFAAALVGVRYVGPKPTKQDTLLYRRRQWRRGEVLRVPSGDAAAYLKHPMVWKAETDPWDERPLARVLSDEDLVAAIRSNDRALLEQCDPVLAARLWPEREVDLLAWVVGGEWQRIQELVPDAYAAAETYFAPPPQTSGEPLQAEDAGRLAEHVPGLALAIVQGVSDSVVTKIEHVMPLLKAYPPLVVGCIAAERDGKNRTAVVKRLESLAADMLSAIRGETAEDPEAPADEPEPKPEAAPTADLEQAAEAPVA